MKTQNNYLSRGLLGVVAGAVLAVSGGTAMAGAHGGKFPNKPITFIVPYSPGGGSDQQARRLQPGLEKALGVKVRIIYKTGGGGAVGFGELWRSKADGYTISNVVVPNIVIAGKKASVGFKAGKFSYIGMTERAVGALMVPKGSKLKTLKDFIAAAKANPGKITVAGVGSTGKVNMAALGSILNIKYTYVPVSGGVGKMIPMLLGKHVDAGMTASNHAVKHKANLDAVVVAGSKQIPALGGVPNESKWEYMTTWGVMAPPGTPADRVKVLSAALLKATRAPSVAKAISNGGYENMYQTPAEAAAYVAAAVKKFGN
jgi:tripartite-type tricarboxylate transporter receptor subunit TctC